MTWTGRRPGKGFTLVLGGGGATGLAYMCGALRAVSEVAGLDPADADLIVGTSAGSVLATEIRLGKAVDEIFGQVDPSAADTPHVGRAWRSYPDLARRMVGSSWILTRTLLPLPMRLPEPPEIVQRLFPASLLNVGGETDWAEARYPDAWPDRPLWIVTADVDRGRRRVLTRADSDAPLHRSVQASCAIPGLYPPVRLGKRRLVDGGVASVTNLDLAAQWHSPLVIALAPMGFDPRQPPNQLQTLVRGRYNTQLERESRVVHRTGKRLLLLRPTGDELKIHGLNILDSGANDRIEHAAYEATIERLTEERIEVLLNHLVA